MLRRFSISTTGLWISFALILSAMVLIGDSRGALELAQKPATAKLLEDNAEALLKRLTNPTGDPGEGHVEKMVIFSGKSSIKIIPMQRFHPGIPGWKYRITEKPKPGEYRYLRFAWKADGCDGIMIQFHDEKRWNLRYTAGVDRPNWGTEFVAEKPPSEWVVVTCDLFKDFGERTLQGIALTAFGGQAAYFDHIYFGRTIEDLDRIDATGMRNGEPLELAADELERLWRDLDGKDAPRAYWALWRLVAVPKQAVPFLKRKLADSTVGPDVQRIKQWIRELDDDQFRVREAASKQLEQHLGPALPLLKKTLEGRPSAEVRFRINILLALPNGFDRASERIGRAIRVLEYTATSEARQFLKDLTKGNAENKATGPAKAALKRIPAVGIRSPP